ncbi:unnamed protein product [Citrullus colocynthis]|uniref:Uncharacterized protein n=1 Tax=Citrullus colocynthis TaxID=252529 RepID=A0ABP0Z1R7_9ROSI
MALDQRADAVFRVIRRRISNLPASRKCPARLPRLDSTKRIVSSMDKVAFSRAFKPIGFSLPINNLQKWRVSEADKSSRTSDATEIAFSFSLNLILLLLFHSSFSSSN